MRYSWVDPPWSADYVRSILDYSPVSGLFYWRVRRPRRPPGSQAGCITNGYVKIKIKSRGVCAHRLAWLIQTGSWPDGEIDHKNTNRSDNRWLNLREATHGQNQSNSGLFKNNVTGLKGVSTYPARPGSYRARIRKDKREYSLGVYPSAEEAHAAYVAAAVKFHGEFARSA